MLALIINNVIKYILILLVTRILRKNYFLMQLRPMSEEKESTIWILSRQQFPKFDHKWINAWTPWHSKAAYSPLDAKFFFNCQKNPGSLSIYSFTPSKPTPHSALNCHLRVIPSLHKT